MITSDAFRGKRYAVLGLARSGLATVAALVSSGAEILAWDEREEARAQVPQGVTLADPLTSDLTGYDGIVVSPGVPINRHPIADYAHAAGVPLIGDIELFALARAMLPACATVQKYLRCLKLSEGILLLLSFFLMINKLYSTGSMCM
jgi:UDP-N-acetylmuramoylalanine--D-glutamate ligase